MRIMYVCLFLLILSSSPFTRADMAPELVQKAEQFFFNDFSRTDSLRIAEQLRPRGLLEAEIASITTKILTNVARCYVNRLANSDSPTAQAVLILVSEGTPYDEARRYLSDAFTDKERREYGRVARDIKSKCQTTAYEPYYLTP